MQFRIDNMTCGGCARAVTRAVQGVDPAAEVAVDLDTKTVEVRSGQDPAAFRAALDEIGYAPAA